MPGGGVSMLIDSLAAALGSSRTRPRIASATRTRPSGRAAGKTFSRPALTRKVISTPSVLAAPRAAPDEEVRDPLRPARRRLGVGQGQGAPPQGRGAQGHLRDDAARAHDERARYEPPAPGPHQLLHRLASARGRT